jgi:hypothetical protein
MTQPPDFPIDDPGDTGPIVFRYADVQPPEHRVPSPSGELPPVRKWPFNEVKLRRMIEQADQLGVARRDLAERLRNVRADLQLVRGDIMAARENPHANALARKTHLEGEITRLLAEQQALDRRAESVIKIARDCESWARDCGWTPDGRHVPRRGPAVAGD